MSQTPPDLDEAWQGLEPKQPRPKQTSFLLALAAAAFLLLGACALGYIALQVRGAAGDGTLVLPTSPADDQGGAGEPGGEGDETGSGGSGLAATATLPADFVTPELPPPAADVVATRVDSPPDLESSGAWADLTRYSSPYLVYSAPGWDGSDDLAAAWRVGWDAANLYLWIEVADDVHAQDQVGNQLFRGDSIDLQIDTDRAGDYGPAFSPDDFQITLSPGNFSGLPPAAFRFRGTPGGEMLDAPGSTSISVAARPQNGGYVLAAAIPWADLDVAPQPGTVLGFALNVSDNDRPGEAVQEVMKSNVPGRRFADPTTWGTLTLQ